MNKSTPDGFHTLTPHIVVADGAAAIEFYKNAFGAKEMSRLVIPGTTTVMHAQLQISDSILMLGGEFPPQVLSPKSRGGTSVFLHLYVADADAAFVQAVKAGAVIRMPLSDTFWGDRYGTVEDPSGHQWAIATRKHNYSPEQIATNAKTFMAQMSKG